MSLHATLCLDGIPTPEVRLHNAPDDDAPYVFLDVGRHGGAISLYGEAPDDFQRLAGALLDAAQQLDAAIERRAVLPLAMEGGAS